MFPTSTVSSNQTILSLDASKLVARAQNISFGQNFGVDKRVDKLPAELQVNNHPRKLGVHESQMTVYGSMIWLKKDIETGW